MKKALYILLTSATLFATPVYAQTPSDESLQTLQHLLLSEQQIKQLSDAMGNGMRGLIGKGGWTDEALTAEQNTAIQNALIEFLTNEMSQIIDNPQLHQQLVEAWMQSAKQHYTQKEVDAMIAFFSSPEGQSMMQKQDVMMKDYMQRVAPIMEQQQAVMMQKMQTELRPKLKQIIDGKP